MTYVCRTVARLSTRVFAHPHQPPPPPSPLMPHRLLSWHQQVAALQCVDAAVAALQLSPAQALAPCHNAASAFWDDTTTTDPKASVATGGLTQHPIATCIRELKPHLKTGERGLGASDVTAYCAQAALFRPPPPPVEPDTGKEANATGGAVPAGRGPTEPLALCYLSTEPPSAVAQVSLRPSSSCVCKLARRPSHTSTPSYM